MEYRMPCYQFTSVRRRVENKFCAATTFGRMFKVMWSQCDMPKIASCNSLSEFYLNCILWRNESQTRTSANHNALQSQIVRHDCVRCRVHCVAHLKLGFTDFVMISLHLSVARKEGTVSNLIRMRRYAIHLFLFIAHESYANIVNDEYHALNMGWFALNCSCIQFNKLARILQDSLLSGLFAIVLLGTLLSSTKSCQTRCGISVYFRSMLTPIESATEGENE